MNIFESENRIIVLVGLMLLAPALAFAQEGKMSLSSPVFNDGELIPVKYGCRGDNINPPLVIANVPDGTEMLVLIMDDPDAPGGIWVHWVVYNIPPEKVEIAENSVPGEEGRNDFKKIGYRGPCPPHGRHRYSFRIYAVDQKVYFFQPPTKENVVGMIKGHVLDSAELVGLQSTH